MKLFIRILNLRLLVRTQTQTQICSIHNNRKFVPGPEYVDKLPVYQYPTAKSDTRRVYAWGFASTGALGIHKRTAQSRGNKKNAIETSYHPRRMTFGELYNVTCITSGYGFSAFGIKSKERFKVFGTGLNTNSQIGYHDPRKGHPLESLLIPAPFRLPLVNPETTTVIQLSAGRAHLLVLTDNEGVFTLGNNAHGQCGRRIIENEDYKKSCTIHHIKNIKGEKIVKIQSGQDHSLFLTESGKVFACGWGSDGQLGNESYSSDYRLNQVQGDIAGENIVKLSSAADSILAINDKGEVFGWGNNEYGQFNLSNEQQQINTSRVLKKCNIFGKIVDVAAAGSYCLMLNDDGKVYSWGYGILGRGPEVESSLVPTEIPQVLFGKNAFNPDSKVIKIVTGLNHSAAVTTNGDIYMWGKNQHGCLGLGNFKDQFFPLRTSIGAEVIDVACGIDHTVALCKPFV